MSGYGGYTGVVPQGVGTKDGGKDALLNIRSTDSCTTVTRKIVFHFSLRRDLHTKLRADLKTVYENNLQPDLVVFVTSRRCTPTKQDELKKSYKDEYGWSLEIYDQEWLRLPLDGDYQAIRKRYLGIDYDLAIFQDLQDRLKIPDRHPNLSDLETGVYYRRKLLHEGIDHILQEKNYCLVLGKPGHGKTALSTAVSFEFMQANPQNVAFYVSARQHNNCREWLEQIRRANHPHFLFIIDDCHLAIEAVNEFVEQIHAIDRARILLVSRVFDSDRAGPSDENYLEILKPVTVVVEINEGTVANIIKRLSRLEDISEDDIGDLTVIVKRCEGDLHLLNFLVRAWIDNRASVKSLADVDEELILEEVFRRYLRQSLKQVEHIMSIVALSQFEIPIDTSWFGNENIIDTLQKDAWIDSFVKKVDGQPIRFFQYFHSTPARLLLHSCYMKGRLGCSVDEFTYNLLKRYLHWQPPNFFELLWQLYDNERTDFQNKLFEDGIPFQVLLQMYKDRGGLLSNQWVNDLSRFIHVIWLWEDKRKRGKAHEILENSLHKLDNPNWPDKINRLNFPVISSVIRRLYCIDQDFINKFIGVLNFEQLGQRTYDAALPTISTFLQKTYQVGVDKDRLNEFCKSLDFKDLGKRSRDVGLATIMNFLSIAYRAGVIKENYRSFCKGLDWYKLGRALRARKEGGSYLAVFNFVYWNNSVDQDMAHDFVIGMGWDCIQRLIESYFSPDVLAALRILLVKKCGYAPWKLTENGIDLRPQSSIWFTSFCQRPCGTNDKRIKKSQTGLLNYALNYIKPQYEQGRLSYGSLDLRAWNILIHNLSQADPDYLETTIEPILNSFDGRTIEFLFHDSDLKNISYFFNLFEPREGPFTWKLPTDIKYDRINMYQKFNDASLLDIAFFLFSSRFIDRKDLAEQAVQYIQENWDIFLPLIEDAELATVEFFLWNLWLALQLREELKLLPQIIEAVAIKVSEPSKDMKSLLAVLGILHLSKDREAYEKLLNYIDKQQAIAICRRASRNTDVQLIRLLNGLKSILPEPLLQEDRELFKNGLDDLDLTLEITRQEYALSILHAWLDEA